MCGSFNNYARKVRNANLPLGYRAMALRSCVRLFCGYDRKRSYTAMVAHLSDLTGGDLCHAAEESHLLDALSRLELARNQGLEVERAFERRRIRQKMRGRRVPSKAERQAHSEAVEAVWRNAGMLPAQKPITSI